MLLINNVNYILQYSAKTFVYNVDKNSWFNGPSMSTDRQRHSCAEVRDRYGKITKIVVAGGYDSGRQNLWTTEIYDVGSNVWYNGPSMPSYNSAGYMVTAPPSSKYSVILSGGRGGNPQGGLQFNPYIMALSKDLTEWTNIENLEIIREEHVAVMVPPNFLAACTYNDG